MNSKETLGDSFKGPLIGFSTVRYDTRTVFVSQKVFEELGAVSLQRERQSQTIYILTDTLCSQQQPL